MPVWDAYFGQLIQANFDVDRPDLAGSAWAAVADMMIGERRSRASTLSRDEIAAWDVYYGNLIAHYRGILDPEPDRNALACRTAATATDAVLEQRRLRRPRR
jgi:hypothetical protein